MRVISFLIAAILLFLGGGLAWAGFEVGYRAIDPDAYRDSKPAVYLIAGGLYAGIGLVLLIGGIAVVRRAMGHPAPLWIAALAFVAGAVPYPWLFGAPALVFNLILLGIAVILLSSRDSPHPYPRSPVT